MIPNTEDELDATVRENAGELAPFMDVEYTIELVVGSTILTVDELLRLEPGDRLKLGRRAADNLLLSIEDTVFGEAEVYRTRNGVGVRVIDIAS